MCRTGVRGRANSHDQATLENFANRAKEFATGDIQRSVEYGGMLLSRTVREFLQ